MKCYFLVDTLLIIINITDTNMDTLNQTQEILARINPKYEFNGKPVIVDDLLVPVEIWGIIIEFLGDFKSINSLSCVCTQLLGITTYFRYVNDVYNYIRAKNLLQKGEMFVILPKELRTYRICLEYGMNSWFEFTFIPEKFRTYELYLAFVRNRDGLDRDFNMIPREFLTEELLLASLVNNPYTFSNIPDELLTYKMCLYAAKRYKYYWPYDKRQILFYLIPRKFLTEELLLILLEKYPKIFQDIPDELLSHKLCLVYVNNSSKCSFILDKIPPKFLTKDLLYIVIGRSLIDIQDIPVDLLKSEMFILAVKRYLLLYFKQIPKHLDTNELIRLYNNTKKLQPRQKM